MSEIHFKPWVGKNYETKGYEGKRILVLGESVYCGEDCNPCEGCSEFTIKCVNSYIQNEVYDGDGNYCRWAKTYKLFESALVGRSLAIEERSEVWNAFVFYNYFQTALGGPRQQLIGVEYDRAADCLVQVLKQFQPQGIIAWSSRLWNNCISKKLSETEPIVNDGLRSNTGYYSIDGNKYPFLHIIHPSSGFAWKSWHLNIAEFIKII